ncbi:MAG: MBL fold metallo-hydrolase [Myxococcota bacterium]
MRRSAALFWSGALALTIGCGDDGSPSTTTDNASAGSTSVATPLTSGSTAATPAPSTETGGGTTTTSPGPHTDGVDSSGGSDSSTGGETQECRGTFPRQWINGTACGEPQIQVHYYDEDTVILRQSLCTSFEGPFMFLLFGEDQVLLEDTGDGNIPIADEVYGVIDDWLAANGRDSIELLVVNSHAHGDHLQGNGLFDGQPSTTVISPNVGALSSYFGIGTWPDDIVSHDLGGRVVDVIPIPGHQTSHIALFDHGSGLLLTGDTLYPGRLYIADFPEYVESIERMVAHTETEEVCHVLGTHIEMTQTAGQDYPFGADAHPDERELALHREHLVELRDAVVAMGGEPSYEAHDDFIIFPLQ